MSCRDEVLSENLNPVDPAAKRYGTCADGPILCTQELREWELLSLVAPARPAGVENLERQSASTSKKTKACRKRPHLQGRS